MSKIIGREYAAGTGLIHGADVKRWIVVDVAKNKMISDHRKSIEATESMIGYARANSIETQMAILADMGEDKPLVLSETY